MKIQKSWVLLALAVVLAAISFPIYKARADGDSQFRFFITPAASGQPAASSLAADGSKISFRGTGTFRLDEPEEVTGGGTWETQDNKGKVTGGGPFEVTRLLKFDLDPDARVVPDPTVRGGVAYLNIKYSDGSTGVLVASCSLRCPVCNPSSPPSAAEGIVASKDFILYGGHVQAGPTFFVVLSGNGN